MRLVISRELLTASAPDFSTGEPAQRSVSENGLERPSGFLPNRSLRFAPSLMTGNKQLTRLFPGEYAVIQKIAKDDRADHIYGLPNIRPRGSGETARTTFIERRI